MKTLQFFLFVCLFIGFNNSASAQAKKAETFDVSGNCGMCKSNIEKAAKAAGATYAVWDVEAKKLSVKYGKNTSVAKIQQKIAAAGYDNAGAKASDESYNKLHGCCQYERVLKAEIKTVGGDNACASPDASCCK